MAAAFDQHLEQKSFHSKRRQAVFLSELCVEAARQTHRSASPEVAGMFEDARMVADTAQPLWLHVNLKEPDRAMDLIGMRLSGGLKQQAGWFRGANGVATGIGKSALEDKIEGGGVMQMGGDVPGRSIEPFVEMYTGNVAMSYLSIVRVTLR